MHECVLDTNVLVAWIDAADSLHARASDMLPHEAITWMVSETERLFSDILPLVSSTNGRLNFNDAFLVLLQREGRIGPMATFDTGFDNVRVFNEFHSQLCRDQFL